MSLPMPIALLVSSLLAVGLASLVFRDRPASRRLFLITLVLMFFAVPIVCLVAGLQVVVGIQGLTLPSLSLTGLSRLSLLLFVSGGLLMGIQLLLVVRARRRLHRLPPAHHRELDGSLLALTSAVAVPGPIAVRIGTSSCSSSLAGRLIVLPAGSYDWQPETLRAVLAHELVHLSRRDDVWLLLARLLMLLFWWLPWLRLLPKLLEEAVEESCDDLAAYLIRSNRDYLHGVFEAAAGRSAAPAGAVRADGGSVADRFRRFSAYREQQIDSRGLYWASLAVLAGLSLVWTVQIVPLAERLPDSVRIVGTATEAGATRLSVQLGEPPIRVGEGVIRTQLPTSDHDPP